MIYWLYNGRLQHDLKEDCRKWLSHQVRPNYEPIYRVWALGKKMMSEKLQNHAIDVRKAAYRVLRPGPQKLKLAIKLTEDGDLLRQLVSQYFARAIHDMGGWKTAKSSGDIYHDQFTALEHRYAEFVLDSLIEYPEGKPDGSCSMSSNLATGTNTSTLPSANRVRTSLQGVRCKSSSLAGLTAAT
jgi:hypothetical protein